MREKIAQYLSYSPRNKVIFTPTVDPCLHTLDMGYELSYLIKDQLNSSHLPMIAEDCFSSIMRKALKYDEIIGDYIAIENWGILFEQRLKFNLHSLFESYSKTNSLILANCGEADYEKFHLVSKNYNTSFSIGYFQPYIIQ